MPWKVVSRSAVEVTLVCALYPQPAYPWLVEVQVEYRLGPGGPTVTTRASNLSDSAAPFGLGFHPYLTVGTPLVDDATLTIPARVRLSNDERGLPVGREPVAGTDLDFTSRRTIGPARLDTAYTDLMRAEDGVARIELEAPSGRRVALWVGEGFDHVMVFTGDTVEPRSRRRRGIAIEPMTCPPNAFASGQGVVRLDAGSTWQATWGIGA
jgi:aldose 1-epimerase